MKQAVDPLSPDYWPLPLRRAFENLPPNLTWTVALSGGLDSTLLLHLARRWRQAGGGKGSLRAIHINHGLQSASGAWADRCQAECERLGVALQIAEVRVEPGGGGLEDSARNARYRIFAEQLGPDEVLLLGHHADDQAETLLYRLMRGAGLTGFAGMPEGRSLGRTRLYRPLLSQTRQQLRTIAEAANLHWVEDPTNGDDRFDRNFLRNQVMPLLRTRWPQASQRVAQNARHAREALLLLDERAREDAQTVTDAESGDLLLAPLLMLSGPRQRNLLQWWLRERGGAPLSENHLTKALPAFLAANEEGHPSIVWQGRALRRYNGRVLVLNQALLSPEPGCVSWRPPAELAWAGGVLTAEPARGQGLIAPGNGEWQVRPRRGGERIRLDNGQHQPLKKWLQANRFAPWERAAMPLLWIDETLVAVGDHWIDPAFRAVGSQAAWRLCWQPPDFRALPELKPGGERLHSD